MRVYVAAFFQEKQIVQDLYRELERAGHQITWDWTRSDQGERRGEELKRYFCSEAEKDLNGIERCQALILLPHAGAKGAYVELGFALACGKRIFTLESNPGVDCVFFHLPEVERCQSLQELLGRLASEDAA